MEGLHLENKGRGWLTGLPDNLQSHSLAFWWALIALILTAGFFYMDAKWYSFLIALLYMVVSLYLVVKFNKGVYLLILLVPFHPQYVGFIIKSSWNLNVGNTPINRIPVSGPIILAVFAGYLLCRWSKLKQFPYTPLSKAFLILFSYGAVLVFYAPNFWHSLAQHFLFVSNIMLFTVIFQSIEDERAHKKAMWFWVFLAVVMGLFALSLYIIRKDFIQINYPISEYLLFLVTIATGPVSSSGYIMRAHAIATPHELGLFMNMSFAIAMGLLLSEKDRVRRWFLIWALCLFFGINLLSLGRGSLIGLIAMCAFLLVAVKVIRKNFFIYSAIFIFGLLFTLQTENVIMNALFLRVPLESRIFMVAETLNNKSTLDKQAPGRMKMWKAGLKHLSKTGFAGLGPGNFKYYVRAPHAHSVYFSFLFDFGLIGLGVIIYIVAALLVGMLGFVNQQTTYLQFMNVSILGGAIGTGVHALVDFEYNTPVVWLYLAVTFATLGLMRSEAVSAKAPVAVS